MRTLPWQINKRETYMLGAGRNGSMLECMLTGGFMQACRDSLSHPNPTSGIFGSCAKGNEDLVAARWHQMHGKEVTIFARLGAFTH